MTIKTLQAESCEYYDIQIRQHDTLAKAPEKTCDVIKKNLYIYIIRLKICQLWTAAGVSGGVLYSIPKSELVRENTKNIPGILGFYFCNILFFLFV